MFTSSYHAFGTVREKKEYLFPFASVQVGVKVIISAASRCFFSVSFSAVLSRMAAVDSGTVSLTTVTSSEKRMLSRICGMMLKKEA